jgi:hypothetical protein
LSIYCFQGKCKITKKEGKKWKFDHQPPEVIDWGTWREGEVWKVEVGMRPPAHRGGAYAPEGRRNKKRWRERGNFETGRG